MAAWSLERGATIRPDGTRFAVWAPNARRVRLVIHEAERRIEHEMSAADGGVWEAIVSGARA